MKAKTTGMSNPFPRSASVVAPAAPSAAHEVEEPAVKVTTKGIMFRLTPADWKRVKGYATTREKSVQELLEIGFNMLLGSEGLEPIDGIPRDKSRSRS